MLRVSSEIAVAIRVWSVGPNPRLAASSRPRWRATTMSASVRTAIDVSCASSGETRPDRRDTAKPPADSAAGCRSRTWPPASRRGRLLVEEGQSFLQIEGGVDTLQAEAELHHGERHFRLHADDDRLGPAQPGHVRDVTHRPDGERVHDVEGGAVDDHPARAMPPHLGDESIPKLLQVGIGESVLN